MSEFVRDSMIAMDVGQGHDSLAIEKATRATTIVVVAHAWYEDLFGGAFRVATELARGLSQTGFHVTFVCCNVNGAADRESIQGVDVRRYTIPLGRLPIPRVWHHVWSVRKLLRQISKEFDVIAMSAHSPLQYLGALLGLDRATKCRCSYVVHSPFADEQLASAGSNRLSWRTRIRAFAGSIVDNWCLRQSRVVQCLSRFTAVTLEQRYGPWLKQRCVVLPGWVDTRRFRPVPDRRTQRKELPLEWQTSDPILFTVRRLEGRMGLDTLIEAAAKLDRSRPFRILIGGTGPEAGKLANAIQFNGLEDRVFLLGRIPEKQLTMCYAAADVFVLPTRSLECFGLIVLEAFASGTPVIGARVGAIPELLSQLGDKWMFDPGDAIGLAHCLRGFLEGSLVNTANLREISIEYDCERLLPRWIELCSGIRSDTSQVGQPDLQTKR